MLKNCLFINSFSVILQVVLLLKQMTFICKLQRWWFGRAAKAVGASLKLLYIRSHVYWDW